MHFSIVSLFSEYFGEPLKVGVVGQGFEKGRVTISVINPREFGAEGVHKAVDDRPFGGGDGMVMSAEPLAKSIGKAKAEQAGAKTRVISFSPQGRPLNQKLLQELATEEHLILICGRYAGVDERLIQEEVDLEISLGDFVVSGGELAALVLVDGVCRLIPNTLGNQESAVSDSFSLESIFEAPLFTRPAEWRGLKVPEILMSGNHKKIEEFRHLAGLARALRRRPDLTKELSSEVKVKVEGFVRSLSPDDRKLLGLTNP